MFFWNKDIFLFKNRNFIQPSKICSQKFSQVLNSLIIIINPKIRYLCTTLLSIIRNRYDKYCKKIGNPKNKIEIKNKDNMKV